ncbi:hypothetical protein JTE90_020208 [Oedothorax gibbosus]|uniref:Uncharacterized protein n=1 Tax=Oedothorax gibbosus TaxID=931172 RepID=A0AAV6THW0_9ARAC|nr:hypothetical protein JTE90_020208 [Oedothorax gibbosus]
MVVTGDGESGLHPEREHVRKRHHIQGSSRRAELPTPGTGMVVTKMNDTGTLLEITQYGMSYHSIIL